MAFASSLDQIGPMTRTVADNALVLDALAGYDRRDATSVKRGYTPMGRELNGGVKGLRIGLPKEFFGKGLAPAVKAAGAACRQAPGKGRAPRSTEVSIPSLDYALPAYYVISSAEASSNLARFDGVRYGYRTAEYQDLEELYLKSRSEGFGPEVKRRILLGTFALSAGYLRRLLQKGPAGAHPGDAGHGAGSGAVRRAAGAPWPPPLPTSWEKRPRSRLEMYLGDIYTVPVNIAGMPGLVPALRHGRSGPARGRAAHGQGAFRAPALPHRRRAGARRGLCEKGGGVIWPPHGNPSRAMKWSSAWRFTWS